MPDLNDATRKLITECLAAIEAVPLRRVLASMGETDGAAPANFKPRRKRDEPLSCYLIKVVDRG